MIGRSLLLCLVSVFSLTGCEACGNSSVDNKMAGQVKKVHHNTPIVCANFISADVSLGVMRGGTGTVSTHDVSMTVSDPHHVAVFEEAAKTGRLVDVMFRERRAVTCVDHYIGTGVEFRAEPVSAAAPSPVDAPAQRMRGGASDEPKAHWVRPARARRAGHAGRAQDHRDHCRGRLHQLADRRRGCAAGQQDREGRLRGVAGGRVTVLTVGELREALAGIADDLPVYVEAEAFVDDDCDTLHARGVAAGFAKAGTGGLFSGPPVERLVIYADGIPEGTCRECGRTDGKHRQYCGEYAPPEPTPGEVSS